MAKSKDTERFEKLSQQRMDYSPLPDGGTRARLTITLANGRKYSFIEDVSARDVAAYRTQVSGIEEVGRISRVGQVPVGISYAQATKMLRKVEAKNPALKAKGIADAYAKGAREGTLKSSTLKPVAKAAKAIATSKVMQTAASGLAMIAPALGPFAPIALGVSSGIGIAGKVLGAKNAAAAGAPMAALSIAQSAISDAQRLAPNAYGSLLQIASDKANAVQQLAGGAAALRPPPQYAPPQQYAPPPPPQYAYAPPPSYAAYAPPPQYAPELPAQYAPEPAYAQYAPAPEYYDPYGYDPAYG